MLFLYEDYIEDGANIINPFNHNNVQGSSYDLTICFDDDIYLRPSEELGLISSGRIKVDTIEYVEIPDNMSGLILARSKYMNIFSIPASWVDSGYEGNLHKVIVPLVDVKIKRGCHSFFQLVLFKHSKTKIYKKSNTNNIYTVYNNYVIEPTS